MGYRSYTPAGVESGGGDSLLWRMANYLLRLDLLASQHRITLRRALTHGFTLVELILVMGLLTTLLAFAAPSLSRSLRQRGLDGEATRLLALTEYARDEAASLGVPLVVWIDTETRHYGVDAKAGYAADGLRRKDYTLNADVSFEAINDATGGGQAGRGVNAVEFEPDGTMDSSSVTRVRLVDRFKSSLALVKTADHYGYEIVKD